MSTSIILSNNQIIAFQKKVLDYYNTNGRALPWRLMRDPYAIVVSEVMLQQTLVDRVIPKFTAFMECFPTVYHLAHASTFTVLQAWQGLGYNRRALSLHKLAQIVITEYGGKIPQSPELLVTLPGIGAATAAAICVYAFSKPIPFIETNIRTVYIHEFFNHAIRVHDNDVRPLVAQTLFVVDPWRWYNALMDYGAMLKKMGTDPAQKSTHYVKQSKFVGSTRQLRGYIIRRLLKEKATTSVLIKESGRACVEVKGVLVALVEESMVEKSGRYWMVKL